MGASAPSPLPVWHTSVLRRRCRYAETERFPEITGSILALHADAGSAAWLRDLIGGAPCAAPGSRGSLNDELPGTDAPSHRTQRALTDAILTAMGLETASVAAGVASTSSGIAISSGSLGHVAPHSAAAEASLLAGVWRRTEKIACCQCVRRSFGIYPNPLRGRGMGRALRDTGGVRGSARIRRCAAAISGSGTAVCGAMCTAVMQDSAGGG